MDNEFNQNQDLYHENEQNYDNDNQDYEDDNFLRELYLICSNETRKKRRST